MRDWRKSKEKQRPFHSSLLPATAPCPALTIPPYPRSSQGAGRLDTHSSRAQRVTLPYPLVNRSPSARGQRRGKRRNNATSHPAPGYACANRVYRPTAAFCFWCGSPCPLGNMSPAETYPKKTSKPFIILNAHRREIENMEHRIETRGLPAGNLKNATNESNTTCSLLCLFNPLPLTSIST